jgi:hypothetical protein
MVVISGVNDLQFWSGSFTLTLLYCFLWTLNHSELPYVILPLLENLQLACISDQ